VAPKHRTSPWIWVILGLIDVLYAPVVVAAVAVPVYHVARDAVWDEEAKQNLRDAHDAAGTVRSSSGSYSAATPEGLREVEPRFRYTSGPSTGAEEISVYATDTRVTVAVRSESGVCWIIDDDAAIAGAAGYRTGRLRSEGLDCSAATGADGMRSEDF
jgi:hypothetical protein